MTTCQAPQRPVPGTRYQAAVKCKYTPGQEVIGRRSPVHHFGTFVRSYVTKNGRYHNVAYVIKCTDGIERSFQSMTKR